MTTVGRGRIRSVTAHDIEWLADGWEILATEAGATRHPMELPASTGHWTPARVPSTVASTLRAAGTWSLDAPPRRFDADDWWYRTTFTAAPAAPGEQLWLCFDGLATIADVWLNGAPLLSTVGMFTARECRLDALAATEHQLHICFRSLDAALAAKRPRPRWRAPMVEHQQLRWFRTSLLGRTPGWSPPAAPVGAWRGVRLERRRLLHLTDVRITAHAGGAVDASCRVESVDGEAHAGVEFQVVRDGRMHRAQLSPTGEDGRVAGRLQVTDVERWWPHTHGPSPLYAATFVAHHPHGEVRAELGHLGFRSVSLATKGDDFSVRVNGVPIFCRGACWTPPDPVALQADAQTLDGAMSQVVAAGMNMLRVSGTMTYESDAFLDRCDAQGVLLWQDFMFANMDFPGEDPAFLTTVRDEVTQELLRWQGRPALAMLCGNSEGEQQAAMWGASRDRWHAELFHRDLSELAATYLRGVPYVPSSAHGGAFPHQVNAGASSYYGVGAYLRPVEDARRADVRFASECLAFANLPSPDLAGMGTARVHHAAWKARTPRDVGAGWDFDDVRDHYLAQLFRVDPVALRYADHERYLTLGRVATGEVMATVMGEWRRRRSVTRGGLVWFLRDLWEGAGWGVIDARGQPKPAWYFLRRAMAPRALALTDEGTNGLAVHLVNDTPREVRGVLDVTLYREGTTVVGEGKGTITVPAHDAIERNVVSFFEGFLDLSYAYRFGPPSHDWVSVRWTDDEGVIARAFYCVGGLPHTRVADLGLSAEVSPGADGSYTLTLGTRRFAQAIRIEADGWQPDDNYFHLAPNDPRQVRLVPVSASTVAPPRIVLHPLNADTATVATSRPLAS
ncbi:MAG: hypothetical protein U0132_14990 [Gemmatimonadaceae bacterium]